MYEQELASVMSYVLRHAGNPALYDDITMQDFKGPAVYFPPPHVKSAGGTLSAFKLTYPWYIKFFHDNASSAYSMGFSVLEALQGDRLLVPVLRENGEKAGSHIRMNDPDLRMVEADAGNTKGRTPRVAQLALSWDSYRPYKASDAEMIMRYITNFYYKLRGN